VDQERAVRIFGLEAQRLTLAVTGLAESRWDLPTGCAPWSVRDLLGHVRVVIAWLPGMLAGEAPASAEVSAVSYYRPDERFAAGTNAARIARARQHALECGSGETLVKEFELTWRWVHDLCLAEPDGRVVRTRHGDAMLLSEFLLTRIVELAIHGLDLARAIGATPWLTPQAGDAVEELLLSPAGSHRELGWDQVTFLLKATGREPLSTAEAEEIARAGIRWLTLG
jgi:uncharacterized protein (TIGR03083 family)